MTTSRNVPESLEDHILDTLTGVVAHSDGLEWMCRNGGTGINALADVVPFMRKATEAFMAKFRDVRGNRGDDVPLSWDDIRLMLLNHLREVVVRLEAQAPL